MTEKLEKTAALYLDLLEQIRLSATSHSEHADKMLTWAIGLMGGGVFYVNSLLQTSLGGHPKPAIDGQLKTGHRR